MLAAPASTAAPPRAKSRASWNPAVPPPPVAGAAVGSGLADGLGAADVGASCVAVCVTDGDSEALALSLAELLAVLPDELAVLPDEIVDVGEADPAGENEVGTAEGVDPAQAETAAEASMVMVLQPMTANLALSHVPAMVVRTFMEPPHASGRCRSPFPVPAPETGSRKLKRDPAAAAPAEDGSPETATAIKVRPTDGTGTRWPGQPWNIRLREQGARGKT
jgi:hypothetical protein